MQLMTMKIKLAKILTAVKSLKKGRFLKKVASSFIMLPLFMRKMIPPLDPHPRENVKNIQKK